MADDVSELRILIAMLARRKSSRIVPRSAHIPCRWVPTTVINPLTGLPFDGISAWHKVADLAEDGVPIREIILENPPGEKAYVMTVQIDSALPDLYIKVQLKGQFIFGRSFHYSDYVIAI